MDRNPVFSFPVGRPPAAGSSPGGRGPLRRLRNPSGTAASALLLLPLVLLAPAQSRGEAAAPPGGERYVEGRFVNAQVPDIDLECSPGGAGSLSRLWEESPLLLTLVFADCAGTCPPFLHSLKQAAGEGGPAGEGYRVVVLSFDPRDTVRNVEHFAEEMGVAGNPGWRFCISSPDGIARITRSVGFRSRWDESTGQFDHPSLLVAIDRGSAVRLLADFPLDPRRLREAVAELRQEFLPIYSLGREVLFRCLAYDPERDRFVFDWGSLLLLAPGALSILFTLAVFAGGRSGRSRPPGPQDTR